MTPAPGGYPGWLDFSRKYTVSTDYHNMYLRRLCVFSDEDSAIISTTRILRFLRQGFCDFYDKDPVISTTRILRFSTTRFPWFYNEDSVISTTRILWILRRGFLRRGFLWRGFVRRRFLRRGFEPSVIVTFHESIIPSSYIMFLYISIPVLRRFTSPTITICEFHYCDFRFLRCNLRVWLGFPNPTATIYKSHDFDFRSHTTPQHGQVGQRSSQRKLPRS